MLINLQERWGTCIWEDLCIVMALTLGKDAIGHYNSIIAISNPYLAAPQRIFQQYKGILYR